MKIRHTVTYGAIAALATAGLMVGGTGVASASVPLSCPPGMFIGEVFITGDGVNIRSEPAPDSAVLGLAYRNHSAAFWSVTRDWVKINDVTTGVIGWISQQYANGNCGTETRPQN